jgi:hypothetical protein
MDVGTVPIVVVVIGLVVLGLGIGGRTGGGPPHVGTDIRATNRDDSDSIGGGGS